MADQAAGPVQPDPNNSFFLATSPGTENPLAATSGFPAFDAAQQNRGSNGSNLLSVTGPVGEPGLPPSRPSSIPSSGGGSSRARTRPSRRGLMSYASRGSWTDPSRPPSAASKTHVPNLTSSAFTRPMSAQKLQGQKAQAQRPTSPLGQELISRKSNETESRSRKHRYSDASIVTLEHQNRPMVDADAPPVPVSRGTAATQADTNVDGTTLRSTRTGGSSAPLHRGERPSHLDLRAAKNGSAPPAAKSPKSAKSLRASLGLSSRNGRDRSQNNTRTSGHEKLYSEPPSPKPDPEKAPRDTKRKKSLGRNWEYYNGNAVFFFSGRILNSRRRPLNVFTALLAVLPAALFFGFSAPWLWHNVSPAIPILFAYVFFICISSFLHASFTDPGILPRGLHPHPPAPRNEDPLALGPPTTDWVTVRSFKPEPSSTSDSGGPGPATAMEVPVKYCKSCGIWRPPRAHHCRICDSCIETQDHHCVWLNNCVGRRNYRYFFTFVASGTILGMFLLAASLAHILVWRTRNHATFGHAINVWRVPFAMAIYAILIIPYPASLWAYHLFLTARGETTREYLNSHKFLPKDRHRPFSQESVLRNWASILLRPRTPQYMRFKGRYQEGDQRLGVRRKSRWRPEPESQDEEKGAMEMKEMPGGETGFQGPASRGRGTINNTPRYDGVTNGGARA